MLLIDRPPLTASSEVINNAIQIAIDNAKLKPIVRNNKIHVDSKGNLISHTTLFKDITGNVNLLSIGKIRIASPINRKFVPNINIPLYIPKGIYFIDPIRGLKDIPEYEYKINPKTGNLNKYIVPGSINVPRYVTNDPTINITKLTYVIAAEIYSYGNNNNTVDIINRINETLCSPVDIDVIRYLIEVIDYIRTNNSNIFNSLVNYCGQTRKFFYHDACKLDYETQKKPLQNKIEVEYSIKSITNAIQNLIDNNQRLTQIAISRLSGRCTSTVKRFYNICSTKVINANEITYQNNIENAVKSLINSNTPITQANVAICMNISLSSVEHTYSKKTIKELISLYKLASYLSKPAK